MDLDLTTKAAHALAGKSSRRQSCNNPACHCFTMLNIPCTPRLHSGDQPCPCPPLQAPLPSLGLHG